MDAERWRRIDALFQAALDRPPEQRPRFLEEQCPDDVDLRREVAAMLAVDAAENEPTLTRPEPRGTVRMGRADRLAEIVVSGADDAIREGRAAVPPAPGDALPFASLGPYRLIEELGRGGLATVYLAERDDKEFSMEVAVKLVRRGLDSPGLLERLRLERQILARLEHPNIARLVDGGTAPDGRPYFVMERIEGERIDHWCERRQLDLRQRIELFRQVCDAVETAHHRLVLHRDIKPSNILVTEGGVPKLLDFGIAKLLDAADDRATVAPGFTTLTDTGMRLLTPEFASPEQVRGESLTTASDVYSLGVLFYLLITGERPYDFDRSRPAEIERVVCEVEPRRPSALVWERPPDQGELPTRRSLGWPRRAGGDDLDTILRQALRKEPELRYDSVARLSSDLRAYLADLPISARPDTLSYLAGKFIRRHRAPVIAAVLLLLVLVAGVVTTSWQARVARLAQQRAEQQRELADEERERAELQRRRAEEATAFLVDLFDVSDPFRTEGERQQITARELLDRGAERFADRLGDDPLLRATLLATIGRVYRNLALLDESESLLIEALALRREALGEDSEEVLESLQQLADLRIDQERFHEAEEILEKLVAERRRRGDPAALAAVLEDLAVTKRALDLAPEAEALLEEALELHIAEGDVLKVAQTRSLLGQLSRRRGDFETAEKIQDEVLEIRRRELGDDHALVALTLNDLALTLQDAGRFDVAEELFREVLESYLRIFGAQNHHVVSATYNLATVLVYQRKIEPALELSALNEERVLALYGRDHPAMARVYYSRGLAHQVAGRPQEAISWIRRSFDIHTAHYGPEHNLALRDANRLVHLMILTGDADAERVLRQLIATMRRVMGPEDPRLAYPLLQLGLLQVEQGEVGEAEGKIREALAIRRASLPAGSWEIAQAEGHLGFCLLRLGRLDEAGSHLSSSAEVLEQQLGAEHPRTQTVRKYLVELTGARARR